MLARTAARGAAPPAWWANRGATNGQPADDYAPINQGQLKNLARAAALELDSTLPGGAGDTLHTMITRWATPSAQTDDYAAVNLGQLKAVAAPVYDRLKAVGYTTSYPWDSSSKPPDDYAMANIGQAKSLFAFDLSTDTNSVGIPDWWRAKYGLQFANAAAACAMAPGGITCLQKYRLGLDPTKVDSDGDGYSDAQEIAAGTNPGNLSDSPRFKPILLEAYQWKLDGLQLTWTLYPVPGIDLQQGTFTFVRTGQRVTTPVTFTRPAAEQSWYNSDGTLHCYLWDDLLLEDDYTYTVTYTHAGTQGPAASVTGSVLDAATLDTIDVQPAPWGGVSCRKLDAILFYMGVPPLFMQRPDFMTIKPGESRTFTVWAAGSIGPVRIALSPAQNALFGTVTAIQTSSRSMSVTYTAANTAINKTQGGIESIGFVVSDRCRSHTETVWIEIVPTSLAPGQTMDWRVLNGEFTLSAGSSLLSQTLPVIRGLTPLVYKVEEPSEGSVTLDDASTGEFTYHGLGNAYFSYSVREADADPEDINIYRWGTVYVHAVPEGNRDPNSDPEPTRELDSPVTIDVSAMKGVVGDEIPSTSLQNAKRHFVSPKQTTAINQPNVSLTAAFNSAGGSFDELYWWEDNGVSSGTATHTVSRAAAGWHVVQIWRKSDDTLMDEMSVWIVWATCTNPQIGVAVFSPNIMWKRYNPSASYEVSANVASAWVWKWAIEPLEIIKGADKPKLNSQKETPVPNAAERHSFLIRQSADTAAFKWDVSRKMRCIIRNPQLIPEQDPFTIGIRDMYFNFANGQPIPFIVAVNFPSHDAGGNDDPIRFFGPLDDNDDEDDDPYHALTANPLSQFGKKNFSHSVGELLSLDAPLFSAIHAWGPAARDFDLDVEFKEFCRLELWGDNHRNPTPQERSWYRVSDEFPWHHAIRVSSSLVEPSTWRWTNRDSKSGFGLLYPSVPQ